MCFMLLFMFEQAVMPAPVQAMTPVIDLGKLAAGIMDWIERAARWIMEETQLGEMIRVLTEIYDLFVEKFGEWIGAVFRSGSVQSMAQRLDAEQRVAEGQAIIETRTQSTIAASTARITAKMTPPKNQHLCKSILVHQLVTTTEDFAREVSRMMAEGVSNRYRAPGEDGTGPGATRKIFEQRCNADTPRGDRLDGIPCFNDTVIGTDGGSFHNADLSKPTADQILEMPVINTYAYTIPITNQTVSWRVPGDPTTDEQRFWLAKFDWLFHIAGRRPTPLSGREMFTANGMAQRAMYNHCAANQNALIKQCSDLVAFYTRPNRADPAGQTLRNTQRTMCLAVRDYIDMERFGNCEQGLSSYEAHLIQQVWCKSPQHYLGLKHSGASDAEMLDDSDVCTMSWTAFKNFKDRKDYNCTAAVEAMDDIESCWKAVKELGKGASGAVVGSADQAGPTVPVHKVKATANSQMKDNRPIIKAVTKQQAFTQGQPVAFDEMPLPQAVGQ